MKALAIILYFCIYYLALGCAIQLYVNGHYGMGVFYSICAILGISSGYTEYFIKEIFKTL